MFSSSRIITALIVVVGVPAVTIGYIALMDWVVTKLPINLRAPSAPGYGQVQSCSFWGSSW